MWKKLTIVLSTVVVVGLVISWLHANEWSFWAFLLLVIAVAAGWLWGMSKLLGVHLGLRSWD